ncbi:hypothetical protein QVD17_31353 [Tagetes erecta]|uniref:Uncharacterized protein n=1 Tax=Tagetes erecta TaxID=13708 RepID=A0AAD8K9K7_TARER|nr:hypothetical protein QVD17_31353 [Tagetes erecta]
MHLPEESDDHIRELMDSSLDLELKLVSSEEKQMQLRHHYLHILQEKDEIIERLKAESRINAQVVNKFTEEIEKLDKECSKSLESNKLEADDIKAKEAAEVRVRDLEQELMLHKIQLSVLVCKDDVKSTAHSFLETNSGMELEVCQKMLENWERLKSSSHKVLALASAVNTLQKEKDILSKNLLSAKEQVKVLGQNYKGLEKDYNFVMSALVAVGLICFTLCLVVMFANCNSVM